MGVQDMNFKLQHYQKID